MKLLEKADIYEVFEAFRKQNPEPATELIYTTDYTLLVSVMLSAQATDKGVSLIDIMPPEIASPEMTGKWELALHEITDGKQDAARFMAGFQRMSAFLVDYAKNQAKAVSFPEDPKRKSYKRGSRSTAGSGSVIEGTVCPLCGKGQMRESPRAFNCTEEKCSCTLWKDCLTRGGGPAMDAKLLKLLLEKRQLKGSTGTLMIQEGNILFFPNGSEVPSVKRSLIYQKK